MKINLLLLVFLSLLSHSVHASGNAQPHFGIKIPVRADADYLRSKKGILADWAEFEITVSEPGKINGIRVIRGSGNQKFVNLQIQEMKKLERFVLIEKADMGQTSSTFTRRVDFLMIEEDSPFHAQVIKPSIELISSKMIQVIDSTSKRHLLFVNSAQNLDPGKGNFEVFELEHEGQFRVLQINLQPDQPLNAYLEGSNPRLYEKLHNNHLISFHEFVMAIRKYDHQTPALVSHNGKVYEEQEFNQLADFKDKTEYWFERPLSSRPVLNVDHIFGHYLGELTLEAYEGNVIMKARVLPSGKIVELEFIKKSGMSRLNEMVSEALSDSYVTPAFHNHRPVADEVVFELNFFKMGRDN